MNKSLKLFAGGRSNFPLGYMLEFLFFSSKMFIGENFLEESFPHSFKFFFQYKNFVRVTIPRFISRRHQNSWSFSSFALSCLYFFSVCLMLLYPSSNSSLCASCCLILPLLLLCVPHVALSCLYFFSVCLMLRLPNLISELYHLLHSPLMEIFFSIEGRNFHTLHE